MLQKELQMDLRIINFPDINFKKYLVDHFDKDGDGEISLTEALTITKIFCRDKKISSIEGIEFFPNLEVLDCAENLIKVIDTSNNLSIRQISCQKNLIESLDISKNLFLKYLNCSHNQTLKSIDISQNKFLEFLYCGSCSLSDLDFSQNNQLLTLSCYFNSLERINLLNNCKLIQLRVRRCSLDEIDLSSLAELEFLDCSENSLFGLDVQNNKKLVYLNCNGNDLHDDLYLGANIQLKDLDCTRNPNLYSITISEGQDIENIKSDIKPYTESYRQYLSQKEYKENHTYNEFNGSYAQDVMGYDDDTINDAFEGDPDAYWNID